MSNIVDINKVKSKKPKTIKVKKDNSTVESIKEWIPKFLNNNVPNDQFKVNFSFTFIMENTDVVINGIIKYVIDNNTKVTFDDYKIELSNNFNTIYKNNEFSMLSKFSSHSLSSFLISLLSQNISVDEILKELLLIDRFVFFCPTESVVLPYVKTNESGIDEIKGIDYVLKSNNKSAVLCRLNVISVTKRS